MTRVNIKVLTPLSQHVGNNKQIETEGRTVREALSVVMGKYPKFKEQLFGDGTSLRDFINVFLNGEDIRSLNGLETKLNENDHLTIMPAIAGG